MKTLSFRGRCAAATILAGVILTTNLIAANVLTLQDGRRMGFRSIRYQESTGEYIVITDEGRFPIPAGNVRDVQVSEPERWLEGNHLLSNRRYDEAVSVFRDIIRDYNRLGWDLRARDKLARAYAGQGEHGRAITQYEDLFRAVTPTTEQRRNYWNALLAAERYSTLKSELDKVITEGEREDVAVAHVMRGNLHDAEGNTMEALFDYLRAHILFEEVTEVQPEALYRAAERLDVLRETERAEKLREILRQRYPGSDYARRAR